MRALAVLFALLVPAGQVLAATHLHCALEHPLGRVTPHALGVDAPAAADHHATAHGHGGHDAHDTGHAAADHHGGHGAAAEHAHDDSHAGTLFEDHHHHHHDGATSSHAGCCIGGAGGAMPCGLEVLGVDVRVEQFAVPMRSGAYSSPFHEPPPRPQWLAHAPA